MRPSASRPLVLLAAGALAVGAVLVGCSAPRDEVEAATPSAAVGLPAGCDDVSTPVHQEDCLDSVQQKLQADTLAYASGAKVTHAAFQEAFQPMATAWSQLPDPNGVSLDTPLGDSDVEEKATTPVSSTWTVGGTSRTLWTCFAGTSVTVTTTRCPA